MRVYVSLLSMCLLFYSFLAQAANVLVLGDSLSASYGIAPEQGWVSLMQQNLQQEQRPYKVVNASISGETTAQGLAKLPPLLSKYKPAVVIVQLGGNDGLRGLPLQLIQCNLKAIAQLSKAEKAKVLLLGVRLPPNYGPAYTQGFQDVYQQVAKQEEIDLVPLFLATVDDKPEFMQEDGIHPRANAQTYLLANVWPKLKPLL
jgi:acyl-CoA thioesterase-1